MRKRAPKEIEIAIRTYIYIQARKRTYAREGSLPESLLAAEKGL